MKQAKLLTSTICIVCFTLILSSCTKQITSNSFEGETQEAIREIKNIIGDEGVIKLVGVNTKNTSDNQVEASSINNNKIRKLSIDEFRKVYKALKTKQVSFKVIEEGRVDSVIKQKDIKSNSYIFIGDDTYDDYDGSKDNGNLDPRPAGLYHSIFHSEILQFPVYGYIDGNNPTLFSNLNVEFKSDKFGMVVGSPSISFSGLRFFSWNQTSSYPIASNQQTYTSSFYVSGKAEFLLGFGNSVLGVGGNTTFKITINLDQYSSQIVKIEIVDFTSI